LKLYKGWQVAFAGMGVNFLGGICYAWSVFAGGLTREFGWTQAQASLPYTVFMFCYAISMIFAGWFQDRNGPAKTIAVGGVFLGASFVISSFFMLPAVVAVIWGVLFGIGLACCFASATPAAMKWFPAERRGLVAGVVVGGMGLSALVMSPLVNFLAGRGVAFAFLVCGLGLGVGIILLSRLVTNPPIKEAATNLLLEKEPMYAVLHTRCFYLLWVMFLLTTASGLTLATHLERIVRVQASYEQGYIIVSLFALFNAAGRPLGGFLSDMLGRVRAMTVTFFVMTLVLIYLTTAGTVGALAVAVACLGLSYGGIFSLFPAAASALFGEKNFGFNYGLVFSAIGVAGFFPYVTGILFDRHGNFTLAFILLSLFSGLAVFLSLFLKKSYATQLETNHTKTAYKVV
jgi:OFA family oxalate/formate antiporter-like MFS transporter